MTQTELIKDLVARQAEKTRSLASEIWQYAELAYQETRSAKALEDALAAEGFTVETGVAGIPTCFTATCSRGSGRPRIGLLGEYDALDSLSQRAGLPEQEPLIPGGAGHGCGHNLLGAGAFAAAVAVKDYLEREGLDGTVIYFGCPAEEGAGSKQFMARAGCFDDIDFCYTWHPETVNEVSAKGNVAIMGANFVFDGVSAHAGGAPHLGRSALDAAELMNIGVNYMREHMIDSARVHYAYSDAGGPAPNVVQSHAVIKYEVRAPKVEQMQVLFNRVVNIAKGAALMTETKMRYEVTMAFSDYTPNKTLAAVMDGCLRELGAPDWTDADCELARRFLRSYGRTALESIREELSERYAPQVLEEKLDRPLDDEVHPFDPADKSYISASTDVGDVGYATPTVSLSVATACLGNIGHSWQNTALSCSEIGMKGMLRAAEVLALSCARTLSDPELIERAKAELKAKNGGRYTCPLPEYVTPPIGRY